MSRSTAGRGYLAKGTTVAVIKYAHDPIVKVEVMSTRFRQSVNKRMPIHQISNPPADDTYNLIVWSAPCMLSLIERLCVCLASHPSRAFMSGLAGLALGLAATVIMPGTLSTYQPCDDVSTCPWSVVVV